LRSPLTLGDVGCSQSKALDTPAPGIARYQYAADVLVVDRGVDERDHPAASCGEAARVPMPVEEVDEFFGGQRRQPSTPTSLA
jgi:hypothetical protein